MSDSSNKSIDERLDEARELINIHKDYKSAEKIYLSVVKEDPEDDRGWYGLLRACTCEFDAVEFLIRKHCRELPKKYTSYYEKAVETASAKNREIIGKRWEDFREAYEELYELCCDKKQRHAEVMKNYGRIAEDGEEKKKTSVSSGSSDGWGDFFGIMLVLVIIVLVIFFISSRSNG